MLETSTFIWVVGVVASAGLAVAGWLWKYTSSRFEELRLDYTERAKTLTHKIEIHDERMRQGITYSQADQLIDLKLAPIRDALERNTQATVQLTNVLLKRKD